MKKRILEKSNEFDRKVWRKIKLKLKSEHEMHVHTKKMRTRKINELMEKKYEEKN